MMLGAPLGKPKSYPTGFYEEAFKAVVAALKNVPTCKSLVVLVGNMAPAPGEERSFFVSKILLPSITTVFRAKPNIDDHIAVIEYINTIQDEVSFGTIALRPAALGTGEAEKEVKVHKASPPVSDILKRTEVAAFALKAMKDESLYGTYPYIGH